MTRDDTTLIHSCGNVFEDLGFTEPEASTYKMRSQLMISIDQKFEGKVTDPSRQQSQR